MRKYRSHKVVEASEISAIDKGTERTHGDVVNYGITTVSGENFEVPASFYARGMPKGRSYLVRYEDGYLSWSPAKAFEDGYTLVADPDSENTQPG